MKKRRKQKQENKKNRMQTTYQVPGKDFRKAAINSLCITTRTSVRAAVYMCDDTKCTLYT